jgi:hypothetical protein
VLEIQAVSAPIAKAVIAAIAAGNVSGPELARDPTWTISRSLNTASKDVFAAYLNTVDQRDVTTLRLGKKTEALIEKAEQLHKQLDRYAYGPPAMRFDDADIDQARAAGVLLELPGSRSAPIICDKALYRELCKQAVARGVQDLRARVKVKTSEKRTGAATKRERTPREELDVEHRAQLSAACCTTATACRRGSCGSRAARTAAPRRSARPRPPAAPGGAELNEPAVVRELVAQHGDPRARA